MTLNNYKTCALFFIVLIISSCTNSSNNDIINDNYINIPDSTFESLLIEKGIDSDGKINHQILKSDAEKVSSLSLNHLSHGYIKKLIGIEGFINLKMLSATQHEIERIDLSSNTLLDTLYLAGNYLTEIDLSNNSNLSLIDIQSNQLKSITGLSNATQLKNLDLSWNYLEEFSIHNESLEILHIRNNDLQSININGAINLKNVLLTTNQLTSIDISTNKLLETLLIPDNKIQNINLDLNSNLTHLYIFSNLLTHLDLSHNLKLTVLKVDRNIELTCIKIKDGQHIPLISKSDYQELNNNCN